MEYTKNQLNFLREQYLEKVKTFVKQLKSFHTLKKYALINRLGIQANEKFCLYFLVFCGIIKVKRRAKWSLQ